MDNLNHLDIWLDVSGSAPLHLPTWAAVVVAPGEDIQVITGHLTFQEGEHLETTAARRAVRRWPWPGVRFHCDHLFTVELMCREGHPFVHAKKRSLEHLLAHYAAGGERYFRLYKQFRPPPQGIRRIIKPNTP